MKKKLFILLILLTVLVTSVISMAGEEDFPRVNNVSHIKSK